MYKMWEGMEVDERGNKKLEPWGHGLVFISVPYENQSCFQGGLWNFFGSKEAICEDTLEGPLPGLMAG